MTINTVSNNLAKPQQRAEVPEQLKEVAEGMEAQFLRHMLEQLKKTAPKVEEQSSAQKYYESLLDGERADLMAKSDHGLGIKELIIEQFSRRQNGQ